METLQLNKEEIRAIGEKLGGGVKTEEELGELTKTLRKAILEACLLYTSPSPRDKRQSRMPSSA